MCGICGQLMLDDSAVASTRRIQRMLDAMAHRGPDDSGTHCDGPVVLGMRRLSIIDLAGGHQPIFSEDRSKAVVLNGEIYNYIELREDLEKRGHRFATQSDTEVIVHLYEEKGPRCVEDLNGMFAFALWDATERRLMLARDRIGIKPLHTYVGHGMLLWSSELPALMVNEEVDDTIDAEAVDDYLTFFYIPGQRSIYTSVRKVLPAHRELWHRGHATTERYWSPDFAATAGKPKSLEHYAEAYREQLKRSVALQLRSDVPVGIFLSGGLDSGALVAAASEASSQTLDTFTVGFNNTSYDERPYARATAERYGTHHHEFTITPDDLRQSGELIRHFGEPFGPFTIAQAHAISKFSREHIKVALAGDGGDELFGGYQTYAATRMVRHYLRLPRWLRRGVLQPLANLLPVSDNLLSLDFKIREFVRGAEMFRRGGNMAWKVIFNDEEKAGLLSDAFRQKLTRRDPFQWVRDLEAHADRGDELDRATYLDLAMFLPDSVLTQTDRMSMAVGQEVRVPMLDHEMVAFSTTVPGRYKSHRGGSKILVRHALKDWLPPEVTHKKKTGFTTPIPIWIRNELKDYVLDTLSPDRLASVGIFNLPQVARLLDEHMRRKADHGRRIWALVSFMLWHDACRHRF